MTDQGPTKQRPGDQVLPAGGGCCVQDRIIAEMQESKRVGVERYGQTLRTFNGRRSLRDAREEARDLFVYLTQIEMEAEATREELVSIVASDLEALDGLDIDKVASVVVDRILGHVVGAFQMSPQSSHPDDITPGVRRHLLGASEGEK